MDPELRQEALQRRANAQRVYDTVDRELELTRSAFPPHMTRLDEIRISPSGNFVPARLNSIADEVAQADAEARDVDSHAAVITAAIDEISESSARGCAWNVEFAR